MPETRHIEQPEHGSDILLSPDTYRVLQRVPGEWWDDDQTIAEIAAALEESRSVVRRRLAHLLALGLVERRRRPTISPRIEIRRVGK